MWSKGFPAENARLQGKPFLVYSLPLPPEIGTPFIRTVLGELFALFASKVPYRNGQLDSCRYYLIIKLYAAITKEEMESVLKYM